MAAAVIEASSILASSVMPAETRSKTQAEATREKLGIIVTSRIGAFTSKETGKKRFKRVFLVGQCKASRKSGTSCKNRRARIAWTAERKNALRI